MIEGKETVYTEIRDNLEYIGTQLNIFVELYRKVHEEEIRKSEEERKRRYEAYLIGTLDSLANEKIWTERK